MLTMLQMEHFGRFQRVNLPDHLRLTAYCMAIGGTVITHIILNSERTILVTGPRGLPLLLDYWKLLT